MPRNLLCAAAIAAFALNTIPAEAAASASTAPRKTLTAFASEQELADLFKRWAEEAERRRKEEARRRDLAVAQSLMSQAAPPASAPAVAAKAAEAVADSVTNVQHAGVDEGGIVKLHGEHLVILRRGRLFTVRVAGGALEPVSSADAFGPDVDPRGAWYDEMLISGNTIAVIGYSYARGGTEVGLFEISRAGRLAHKGTYHLRSNDYYSSRNYASRLIGTKLVFYSPLYLNPFGRRPVRPVPGDAPVAPGRDAGRLQAHRAGDAHLPHRRAARPVRGRRAAHGLGLRAREAGARVREHRGAGPAGARVLRLAGLGVRLDDAVAARRRRRRPAPASSASRSTARRRAR